MFARAFPYYSESRLNASLFSDLGPDYVFGGESDRQLPRDRQIPRGAGGRAHAELQCDRHPSGHIVKTAMLRPHGHAFCLRLQHGSLLFYPQSIFLQKQNTHWG